MAAIGQALLSASLQVALENLASPIIQEFGRRIRIDKDLKKLIRTLSKIQSVLDDAEAKQIRDISVKLWLDDLKEVAYDADDLLDEVATEAFRFNQQEKVTKFLSLSKDFVFKLGLAPRVREINERLEEIAKERDDLGLKEGFNGVNDVERSQTSSLIDESQVFGRGQDVEKVVKMLVLEENSGSDGVFRVVSIVGMGGLGKTTLAQLVFNDCSVVEHFEVRVWICVSDDFSVRRLTKSILESIEKRQCDLLDLDTLQTSLRDRLMGRKFLVVLDDVWTEKESDWELLRLPFRAGAVGSKIVVTTRSKKVATAMGSFDAYHLEVLSFDDCWSLFKQRAFIDGNETAHPNLVPIGKEIVKKCQGLPLAAKALGGLLHGKTEVGEWKMILQSDIWELGEDEDENEILPALRLSYNHLPAHLKQCFVYCSIFPKDHNFEKETLVLLWMAEGFVQPKRRRRLEDVASDYFDDLLRRSFFQQSKTYTYLSRYVMHDLIHDLAQSVAGEICFRFEGENLRDIPEKARHSSMLVDKFRPVAFEALSTAKGLRTLLLHSKTSHDFSEVEVPCDIFRSLKCLRSLDMSHIAVKNLPDTVGDLMHMRYLDLSYTFIKELPESVCNLCNLQTLILTNCNKLVTLPKGTKDLVNLRHLNLTGCWHLISMPPSFGRLKSLHRLHRFVAGKEVGCGIGELKDMNELRETLCIDRVEDVLSIEEAKEASLKTKQYIHKLVLRWSRSRYMGNAIDDKVLECLEPHNNLRELTVDVYPGFKFPNWMGDPQLSHLETIEFFHCNNVKALPPLGQLPFLKSLSICMMEELKYIGREFYGEGKIKGFPSLKKLKLEDMRSLKEWQVITDGEFPVLEELSLSNCPIVANLPKFPSLHNLLLNDCHEAILNSVQFLTSLTSLKISNFRRVDFLPEGLLQPLTALEELKIEHFYRLKALQEEVGMQNLQSLQRLELFCCPRLLSFADNGFPCKLQYLSIGMCSSMRDLPNGLGSLSVLQELNISKCPKLVSFSEDKLPSSLKSFRISSCANLESLPPSLDGLENLEYLGIQSCPKIVRLPVLGLPASLRSLSINECKLLEERCAQGCEDWSKIEHVPEKYIRFF